MMRTPTIVASAIRPGLKLSAAVYPNYPQCAERLGKDWGSWLEQGLVAATPGSAFYAPGWIRLSYATSMDRLKEAMGRIRRVSGK